MFSEMLRIIYEQETGIQTGNKSRSLETNTEKRARVSALRAVIQLWDELKVYYKIWPVQQYEWRPVYVCMVIATCINTFYVGWETYFEVLPGPLLLKFEKLWFTTVSYVGILIVSMTTVT